MPTKSFYVEFYQADARDGDATFFLSDLLAAAIDEETVLVVRDRDPAILVRNLVRAGNDVIRGVIWKIKKEDLPTAGTIEGDERELRLMDREGLVYKNHFMLIPQHQILVYERNGYALTSNQLASFLTTTLDVTVALNDIVQPDAIERMMRGESELRRLAVTIAHPSNPELLVGTDFGRRAMEIHQQSGGSSLHIRLGTDMRSHDPGERRLADGLKTFMRSVVEANAARSAKVQIADAEGTDLIDLISDRLICEQTIEYTDLENFERQMYRALADGFRESRASIRRYFGDL